MKSQNHIQLKHDEQDEGIRNFKVNSYGNIFIFHQKKSRTIKEISEVKIKRPTKGQVWTPG